MKYPAYSIDQCCCKQIGKEQTSILIVDNFADDITALRQSADMGAQFRPDGKTAYPGIRAAFPSAYMVGMLEVLYPLLYEVYQVPRQLEPDIVMAYYSLLTTPEVDLNIPQRMPHMDTSKQHYYAVLYYLNDGDFGGTGFFRHRPTGFERMNEERRDIYNQSVWAFMATRGVPEPRYIVASNKNYELIEQVDYKSNRLVVYPGNLLHSSLVSGVNDLGSSPLANRLTANIFIEFK